MLERPQDAAAVRILPSGTVAFLFTDIEGSTQRWDAHRDAMTRAIERHDELLETALQSRGGYVFKRMGDAFCAAFRTAPEAIAAAYEAQRLIAAEDFSEIDGLKVRMAVHVGHAEERSGDYFGPSVNRVARLLAIGYGGQVLISGAAADLAQGEMPAQAGLRDLGSHRLKDLAQPEQVYQLVAPDLPQKFFALRSLDALPNNLPLQLTSFIGRDSEIEAVKTLLETHRLVSLVGTGGVGKSRLALQVGADVLDSYEDGVWFVELAPLSDGTLILNEIAPLFGVQAVEGRSLLDAVIAALRPKHALLIVDNCEHLVDPAAGIIEKILRGCPNVRVLATSREALKITGETVHRVSSLDETSAIALFADRARASTDTFALTPDNTETVAKICRRVDGIALAIELAAARVRALDVDQLFARLDERFRILTGGSRSALPRQQTMRALIDWSYDLLSPQEQALLRRVSVFAGAWTMEAATEICAGDIVEQWDVLDYVTSLVDKSLVVAEMYDADGSGSRLRYRLLESTRQYTAEKLHVSGERDRLRQTHAAYFKDFAQRAEREWSTTPTRPWIGRVLAEIDNVRAAIDWALAERNDLETAAIMVGSLWPFWTDRSRAEGLALIVALLEYQTELSGEALASLYFAHATMQSSVNWTVACKSATTAKDRFTALGDASRAMQAQAVQGESMMRVHDFDASAILLNDALAFFKARGERRWANLTLLSLARHAIWTGDSAMGRERYDRVVAEAKRQGDDRTLNVSLNNLAECEFQSGNVPRAIELGRECVGRAREREADNAVAAAFSLSNLAAYLVEAGDAEEAHAVALDALRKSLDAQMPTAMACTVQHIAAIAAVRGDFERAALLLGYTNSMLDASLPREWTEQHEYDAVLPRIEAGIGAQRTAELLKRGEAMSQEEAIAESRSL